MGKIITNAEIGEKLREFRLQAGLTQEKLAEKLGITFQQIQKHERGVTKVNIAGLQQFAEVLNVPISAFFDESGVTAYKLTEEELKLLRAFREIKDPHLQDSIIHVVENVMRKKAS